MPRNVPFPQPGRRAACPGVDLAAAPEVPTGTVVAKRTPFGAPQPEFLPMSRKEMDALGWDELDVLLVSGDAYVDHYAMGSVLLGRWLVAHGFRAGLVCQPRWENADDLLVMGRPRLFVGISAGALDSLLAHYTAFRKKRHDDAYTPGGRAGARPNRACIVYANLARQAFPGLPVILGGIEASLRRVSHYDFWTDSLRRSVLMDAKADLLLYGMGERAVLECARRLQEGRDIRGIDGSVWMDGLDADGLPADLPPELAGGTGILLPSHEQLKEDPAQLLRQTRLLEQQVHGLDRWAFEPVGGNRAVVLARPAAPLTTEEMDALYSLPFTRKAHPAYTEPVPAEEMLRTSITSHRGCGGGCSFCSLALHQGRRISSRSQDSILAEAAELAQNSNSRRGGLAISDVGGPTANMWQGHCALDSERLADGRSPRCRRASCCFPTVCRSFITPQMRHVELLRAVQRLPGVRQVRVASGVRADLALREPDALAAYTGEFTGGQLKVAPEHCVPRVLERMRKPPLGIKPPQIDGKQHGRRMRRGPAQQREQRRPPLVRRIVHYAQPQFPGGMPQFQMQQPALVAGQNQQRRRVSRTRRQRTAGSRHAPQQRPPEFRRKPQPRSIEIAAAARRKSWDAVHGSLPCPHPPRCGKPNPPSAPCHGRSCRLQ